MNIPEASDPVGEMNASFRTFRAAANASAEDIERARRQALKLGIPETTSMPRRPVYERLLRRKHLMPLDVPTRREYEDALRVLVEAVENLDAGDELEQEALRILRERE